MYNVPSPAPPPRLLCSSQAAAPPGISSTASTRDPPSQATNPEVGGPGPGARASRRPRLNIK